jgi:putative intracellular protease/amidase/YHS domain-containing protein
MNRRELIQGMGVVSLVGGIPFGANSLQAKGSQGGASNASLRSGSPLKPPAHGSIPVGFVISEGAVVIDFSGPWEVFQDVYIPGQEESPFRLYTVSGTTDVVQASDGLKITPDYTFKSAPLPKVIVIPAQNGITEEMLDWIRHSSKTADLTMSVCTGAIVLARTGLLAGKAATTHHGAYKTMAVEFPDIRVKRGARFVEEGNLATAGGLSSGIDLALRVVERYFGRDTAVKTADQMEYQGQGWLNPDANQVYAKAPISTEEHPLCPVCDMDADKKVAKSVYQGKTYYFCMPEHKALFDKTPEKYLKTE